MWKTTVKDARAPRATEEVRCVVRILRTPKMPLGESRRVELRGGTVLVGRGAPEGGVSFADDERVSRKHATLEISVKSRSATLTDSSSTGTFVEGERFRGGSV